MSGAQSTHDGGEPRAYVELERNSSTKEEREEAGTTIATEQQTISACLMSRCTWNTWRGGKESQSFMAPSTSHTTALTEHSKITTSRAQSATSQHEARS